MKSIIIILMFFLSGSICTAQENALEKKIDSLSKVSRAKADFVLSKFDSIKADKILYSISDEKYYVVFKKGCCYSEYYISVDSVGKVKEKRLVKLNKGNKKLFKKAFELHRYRNEFITRVDNPKEVQGNLSYFVVKDISGKRYGEYWLSVITIPIPIDKQLYSYLLTQLLKESTLNKKSN